MDGKNRFYPDGRGISMHTKLTPQERLKDLRVVDKHLTLEQLEAQTGLSRAALGNYERKNQGISAFAIATLANFYLSLIHI